MIKGVLKRWWTQKDMDLKTNTGEPQDTGTPPVIIGNRKKKGHSDIEPWLSEENDIPEDKANENR